MKLTAGVLECVKKSLAISEEVRIKAGPVTFKVRETHGVPIEIYFELRKNGRFTSSETVPVFDHPLLMEVINFNFGGDKDVEEILLIDSDGAFARVLSSAQLEPYYRKEQRR